VKNEKYIDAFLLSIADALFWADSD